MRWEDWHRLDGWEVERPEVEEETAGEPGVVEVEDKYRQHGEGAEAVDGRAGMGATEKLKS